jgi:hypothetical protein
VTCIINNILYEINAFGKQLKFLIKLIMTVDVFFFLAKSLIRLLILKINQHQKNYHILKNLQD